MLSGLVLDGVGPAKRLEAEFAPRLNLITGDNGLGKSFLLDVAWWALTRTWPGPQRQALPRDDARKPSVRVRAKVRTGLLDRVIPFDFKKQSWVQPKGRPPKPGLVIYAQSDSSFAVWDPARNYWNEDAGDRPSSFLFEPRQVWTGVEANGQWICNGLYRDWGSWQREKSETFRQLEAVLSALSPLDGPLRAGPSGGSAPQTPSTIPRSKCRTGSPCRLCMLPLPSGGFWP